MSLSLKTLLATAATLTALSTAAVAARPVQRIVAIDNTQTTAVPGTRPPQIASATDLGALSGDTVINGMTLSFTRTAAQQADLDALLAALQDPNSPQYHQWLTPAAFGARFGMSDADLASTTTWLQQQGFTINGVSNSRDRITFSGTATQVRNAFAAELHSYQTADGARHFAPSADLSLPAALANVVLGVGNVSDFRPHAQIKPASKFTSAVTGSVYMTTLDLATLYDINAAYSAGYTGAGQSIAVIGQSAVYTADVAAYQTAMGQPTHLPTLVLMPGTGASTVFNGDEGESDLDLEYTSTIAKGASIYFVYTGYAANYGAFDALTYAVDNRIANIISSSYGNCEAAFSTSSFNTLQNILAQAAAEGITVMSASGDSGSTDCYGVGGLTTAQQQALAVDLPAASQYVTAVGGTEIPTANITTQYFQTASGSDVVSSVKSYIPEQVWDDSSSSHGISAGGGGISSLVARPSWQAGVTGIPAGTFRLLPDVSLDSSNYNVPLTYCSQDRSGWSNTQSSSCTFGLRDSNSSGVLTIAGGTSFAAPTFSAMLAIIEQAKHANGLGVINPTLYTLASNATTYASAFHDITVGGNQCLAGSSYCVSPATTSYLATTGYDLASGLGSVDVNNLIAAWPNTSATALAATTTTVTPNSTSTGSGTADNVTILVSTATGTASGTVAVYVDGATTPTNLTLVSGQVVYTFSSTTSGTHTVSATYSGDVTHAASSGSAEITVQPTGSFTVGVSNLTLTAGSSGTVTITVTPTGGYNGTVNFTVPSYPTSLTNACISGNGIATVTGTAPATTTFTIYTSSTTCSNLGLSTFFKPATGKRAALDNPTPWRKPTIAAAGVSFALMFLLGTFRRRSRSLPLITLCGFAAFVMLASSGCSGSSNTGVTGGGTGGTNTSAGTYSITVQGYDSTNTVLSASTTFTLTVQ